MPAKLRTPHRLVVLAASALGLTGWLAAQEAGSASGRTATLLTVHDAIGPATAHYIEHGLSVAATNGSELAVLELDTPGGLDTSMRDIIQAILASPVPVVTYVYPQGARAASAGTYILYASHIAAMAPATNLGAATPISITGPATPSPTPSGNGNTGASPAGGNEPASGTSGQDSGGSGSGSTATPSSAVPQPATAEERKAVNDAVAYIRSLAEQRGRNADWAEQAVRSAASLSAKAALDAHVIDLIATDLDDLSKQLDGRQVNVNGREVTLSTKGLVYVRVEPDWRTKLLAVLTNPTVAYMFLLLGIYGLIFEGYNPGAVLPGVVGAISLLLALFAFQILPVNYAGLALILLGVILMIAEFMVPSFGALGIGGITAFVFGSVILMDADVPGYGLPIPLIVTVAVTGAVLLMGTIWLALKARALPVVSGVEELKNSTATALEDFQGEGPVWIRGERWQARSARAVHKGERLRVVGVDRLVLTVEPEAPAAAAPLSDHGR
jgi:membrane-bound serine protease (ClpP class)